MAAEPSLGLVTFVVDVARYRDVPLAVPASLAGPTDELVAPFSDSLGPVTEVGSARTLSTSALDSGLYERGRVAWSIDLDDVDTIIDRIGAAFPEWEISDPGADTAFRQITISENTGEWRSIFMTVDTTISPGSATLSISVTPE